MEKNNIFNDFEKLKQTEIKISLEKPIEPLHVCTSKIGGHPDLPKDFVWPFYDGKDYNDVYKNRPLAFLAQINLEEASQYDSKNLLPKNGLLSFFYELESHEWGLYPNNKGCARVFYFDDSKSLAPTEFPIELENYDIIPEYKIQFSKKLSLPSYEEYPQSDKISFKEFIDYRNEAGYLFDNDSLNFKLLGYPDIIQDKMQLDCEKMFQLSNLTNKQDFAKISDEELLENSKDWILLFQMGTIKNDNNIDLMFGDSGHIYFWIRKQDLENKNFDNIWLKLQCY